MKFTLATITTPNQLSKALALCQRTCELNSEANCRIYILGPVNEQELDLETLQRTRICPVPEQLLDRSLEQYARTHSATELCCLLKPAILLDALSQAERVVYADTDIYMLTALNSAFGELGENNILLTPHLHTSLTNDDREPSELTILRSGIYNAGLLILQNSPVTRNALNWWLNHLLKSCYIDYARMMNADQKWLDLLPTLFDGVKISNNPGINAGYWTMSQFNLESDDQIRIGGHNLVCFHFSGLDERRVNDVSRHQNRHSNDKEFTTLAEQYLDSVQQFKPWDQSQGFKFRTSRTRRSFQRFADFLWRCHDGILKRWPKA